MVRAGLAEKPKVEKPMNFKFPSPGHLPPPVLAFRDVSFAYPNCQPLYDNVNFGVDLDSRVALVGPNGAGKTTLVKLMSGELEPSMGDIRPHMHLKMGRFTQHFIDVLDLSKTPLEFFQTLYPGDAFEELRKYLGRFGVSGKMQVQQMEQLSDGQKSRVVFAKLGRECPHILLLDEPTNHLDMESIDALAMAVNAFDGGLVLVSHDMRLISQVAKEIWICDHKCVKTYRGDIQNFKMDMRSQMGITSKPVSSLRGDASVMKAAKPTNKKDTPKKEKTTKSVSITSSVNTKKSINKVVEISNLQNKPSSNATAENSSLSKLGSMPSSSTSDKNNTLGKLENMPSSSTSDKSSTLGKVQPLNATKSVVKTSTTKEKNSDEIKAELESMSKEVSAWDDDDEVEETSPFETATLKKALSSTTTSDGRYVPPHLRNR
eukprot:CAMPEP_0197840414 /NCGR_PEP_ID=MMETSP1437-20131217/45595_1 /TAXON_ID=49252 ORGANISM="Eucampia antarctica, Strain CCMP1452" /NCGR_SAMPLE_ID=MMETSP1437 /ASSEMBLY_ACC=CAM_ASM_001096 /LENGTH=431 /DNA_ID=CAMNT_0043450025 /DNA_START=20 /DNA_END=1318 /DNA_ORIENTATION=-